MVEDAGGQSSTVACSIVECEMVEQFSDRGSIEALSGLCRKIIGNIFWHLLGRFHGKYIHCKIGFSKMEIALFCFTGH